MGPACQEFVLEEDSRYLHTNMTPQAEKTPKHSVTTGCEMVEKHAFHTIKGALGLVLELCQLAISTRETKSLKAGTTGPVFFIAEGEKLKKRIFCFFAGLFSSKEVLVLGPLAPLFCSAPWIVSLLLAVWRTVMRVITSSPAPNPFSQRCALNILFRARALASPLFLNLAHPLAPALVTSCPAMSWPTSGLGLVKSFTAQFSGTGASWVFFFLFTHGCFNLSGCSLLICYLLHPIISKTGLASMWASAVCRNGVISSNQELFLHCCSSLSLPNNKKRIDKQNGTGLCFLNLTYFDQRFTQGDLI